ncbi:unnamed protein product [Urochloa humidicola]
MEKISVAVRFRQPIPTPPPCGGDYEWRIEDARVSLLHRGAPVPGASFTFDHVFDGAATNARVYDALVRSLIRAAIDGFNGTVFAYGQTSSGKTHTMSGFGTDPGIIPLAVRDLFDTAREVVDREFCFKVSYMEIYNEDINDLLMFGSQKLPIRDNSKHEACVGGLREDVVESAEQTLDLLKLGEANRHFGQTNMNARSARSHTIFRMVIESRVKNQMDSGDAIRVSVLNLVDLAGSERQSKTGVEGVPLKEGIFINKSLMNLGIVINKLSENGTQMGHIPYRDSRLTRILEPALGGNAKTSIICTAAPEEIHIDETKGTLQFASRTNCVSNCVQVNEILTDAVLIERQKEEINDLRKRLHGSDAEAMEKVLLKQCDDIRKYELELDRLTMELEQERKLREASTSSDQFTSSIEAAPLEDRPTDVRCQRLEKDCSSDRQALEMELDLLRKENALLLQELSRSKEKAELAVTEKQELLREVDARCRANLQSAEEENNLLREENNLLKEENSCLVLELSRSKQEASRLIADKQAQTEEALVRCAAALREKSSLLALAREADEKVAEGRARLVALEELSASRQEAERLAAEKQELAAELGAEKLQRTTDAAAFRRQLLQLEEEVMRLLVARAKAIVEYCNYKARHRSRRVGHCHSAQMPAG